MVLSLLQTRQVISRRVIIWNQSRFEHNTRISNRRRLRRLESLQSRSATLKAPCWRRPHRSTIAAVSRRRWSHCADGARERGGWDGHYIQRPARRDETETTDNRIVRDGGNGNPKGLGPQRSPSRLGSTSRYSERSPVDAFNEMACMRRGRPAHRSVCRSVCRWWRPCSTRTLLAHCVCARREITTKA